MQSGAERLNSSPIMIVEILTAVCLFLVLEGIFPFLSPGGYKRAMQSLQQLTEYQLRIAGLSSMIVGAVLLVIIR